MLPMLIGFITAFTLFIIVFILVKRINARISAVEEKLANLSIISNYFPDFLKKSQDVTKSISEELTLKQNQLKKLLDAAQDSSKKLAYLEEKIKENKLEKETINKILILVNQGFTPEEISPKLNIPIGEIDLVIKLKKYLVSPIKEKL